MDESSSQEDRSRFGPRDRLEPRLGETMRRLVLLVVAFLAVTVVADAQVVGLKVTPTAIIPPQVDFDVTLYATTTAGAPGNLIVDAPGTGFFTTNFVGSSTFGTTYVPVPTSGTSTYFFTVYRYYSYQSVFSDWSGFDTPNRPAIDFGDGSELATASLALDATATGPGGEAVYRGSFSHSYGTPGSYTITARKGPDWDLGQPGAHDNTTAVFTGVANTGSLSRNYTTFRGSTGFAYFYYGSVTSGGGRFTSLTSSDSFFSPIDSTFQRYTYPGTVVSISNTASTGQVPVGLLRFDVE
jgi:hypothetical protein